MTSFDQLAASVEGSRPVELYTIERSGEDPLRYTSSEDEITIGGDTWEPLPIARGAIRIDSESRNRNVQLTVPATLPFVAGYVNEVPAAPALVSVLAVQRDEVPAFDTVRLRFQGVVDSVSFPDDTEVAQINVKSIDTALNRTIPRASFSGLCNHFLFDQGCGVDPGVFSHTGLVTGVTGAVVTVDGAAASGLSFLGGFVKPTTSADFRLVIGVSGDSLTLQLPFGTSPAGLNMQAFPVCDHSLTGDCSQVFGNADRFDGFHFVPNRNPYQDGIGE